MAKVLLVDDDESMRRAVNRVLRSMTHEVVEAVNGEDALTKLDQGPFDVVLTDKDMPNMNGTKLLARPEIANIPIKILMSGNIKENGKTEQYWQLSKPFEDEVLAQIIAGTYTAPERTGPSGGGRGV